MLRPLFHLGVLAVNLSIAYYDYVYIDLPLPVKGMEKFPVKGRSMYITCCCLMVQNAYHFIALLNDIKGTNAPTQSPPTIRRIQDVFFPSAFSFAIYVTLLFWTVYTIDSDLVAPKHILDLYPPIVNHVIHTTTTVFIVIDLLLPHKNYPSRKLGLSVMLSMVALYIIWYFFIYIVTGSGIYPLFKYLDAFGRTVFFISSILITIIFYIVGEKLNNFISNQGQSNLQNGVNKVK